MQNYSKTSIFSDILTLNKLLNSPSDTVFPWQYQKVKTMHTHPDAGSYTAYGLELYQCKNGQRTHIDTITDISTRQDYVENLALAFTINQLSPVHFRDAVLDAIG